MSEPRAWADAIGLDIRGKPDWIVGFAIETTGKLPARDHGGYTTRFELFVAKNLWSVRVCKRGQEFNYIWLPRNCAYRGESSIVLSSPKKLATIGRWLTTVERELHTKFRRDRPTIHSNVKGGARAIARWCTLGLIDIRKMPV